MINYTLDKWLLLFFIYSFLGWIWETFYVSLKRQRWTNRGFLFGPFLPIYGFGAIIMLIFTYPFTDSLIHIYVLGAIGATLLELVTGYIMEKLFNMRYWDYSYKKYQYKGYICLTSTVAWGFFAIILVKVINVPVENWIATFRPQFTEFITILLLIAFVADTTKSVQNAYDLKKLLETISTNNIKAQYMVGYLEDLISNVNENADIFMENIQNIKDTVIENKDFSILNEKISNIVNKLAIDINIGILDTAQSKLEKENREKLLNDFNSLKLKFITNELVIKNVDLKDFKGALKLLKRNPTAKSDKLQEEIEKIKEF